MGDRGSMQGTRDWHSDRDSERDNGERRRWHEEGNGRERGHGNERRRDSPEQHGRRYEHDDGRYGGQTDWYVGHSSAFGGNEGGWQRRDERQQRDRSRERGGTDYSGGGQREQCSSRAQYELSHKLRPYGSPGNTQWREEMERDAGAEGRAERERLREKDERYAEQLRMQAAGAKERARRLREGEEARAAAIREQKQRQELSQDVAAKMTSGMTIRDDEHFPKTRKEVRLLAYVCTRARTKNTKGEDGTTKEGTLLLPEKDHGDILENMLNFFTGDPDFVSADETYKKMKTLASSGDELFGAGISSKVAEVVKLLNEKMKESAKESVRALPEKERTMMRLLESAKRKGALTALAKRLADAKAIAIVEASPTLANMHLAFDEVTKKADGRPWWSLSANAHSNLVSFTQYMKPAMKEKYPKSNDAVKVLELARDNGHLHALAKYAADKKAAKDDDDSGGLWE